MHPAARWFAGAQLTAIACAAVFLRTHDPVTTSLLPPCPTHRFLGLYCPGCGSLRALHHVLNGQFTEAWRFNPAMMALGLPVAVAYIAFLLWMALRGRRTPVVRLPRMTGWAVLAALVLYGVLRNIPLAVFEFMRPPM